MRQKGLDALELVFAMFILIVVTLVVIRLFSSYVTKETLPPLDDFRKAYDYERQKSKCDSLCSDFTQRGNCEDLSAAVTFCQTKVSVDIDGNYKTGEPRHFGIIAGIPYCEDGLYCFHMAQDCACGSMVLSAETCLSIMQDYYMNTLRLPEVTANDLIKKRIFYGTCEPDPFKWKSRKLTDGTEYIPQRLPDGSVLGADYWYKAAGYDKLETGTPTSTTTTTSTSGKLSLSNCKLDKSTSPWGFSCNTNCVTSGPVVVRDSSGTNSIAVTPDVESGKLKAQPSEKNTLNKLKCPDTWTVYLTCENPDGMKDSPLDCS